MSTNVDVPLGKGKLRDRSQSPTPRKRSRTNQDPDNGVVSIPDSDDDNIDHARRTVALKSTLDPDTVIKAFRLKKAAQLVRFRPHDLPFNLGIVSGLSITTNFCTLPWVIRSRTRSKTMAKLLSVSLSVNISLYILGARWPYARNQYHSPRKEGRYADRHESESILSCGSHDALRRSRCNVGLRSS